MEPTQTQPPGHRDAFRRQFNRWAPPPPVNPRAATGQTLTRLVQLAEPKKDDKALDVSCGLGYTAFAIAPSVKSVVATDFTEAGLSQARAMAAERQVTNVTFELCEPEALPFRDASFDLVVTRNATHQFDDVRRAVREIARVTAKGGRVVIIDSFVPMDDEIDKFLNHLERLRESTHVRTYNMREWKVLFADAGLKVKQIDEALVEDPRGENLREWLGRVGTNPQVLRQVTGLLVGAKGKIKEALGIRMERGDVCFQIKKIALVGEK